MPPPRHLALIPDGNRRWARARNLPDAEGHRRGFLIVAPEIVRWWLATDIPDLTLWLFSTDNWRRSPNEIASLMDIYAEMIPRLSREIQAVGGRIEHLGRADRLPERVVEVLRGGEAQRRDSEIHRGHRGERVRGERVLRLAIDYGGQEEIVAAVAEIVGRGEIPSREAISAMLPPPPDLIVRTSGEQRLSGFLLWGSASAEVMFLRQFWPDLRSEDLAGCVARFGEIERRYGA